MAVPSDLIAKSVEELSPFQMKSYLDWTEKVFFKNAFVLVGENKTRLAERLGVSRDFIHRKLKDLAISEPSSKVE